MKPQKYEKNPFFVPSKNHKTNKNASDKKNTTKKEHCIIKIV